MVCNVITADKANRLFWLGRYAERVYVSLHLLRRYYDKVIDGDITNLQEYYNMLGVDGALDESCQLSQLYGADNICSIASSLEGANDNAIVLRRDITSESLSYIQMSKSLLADCATRREKNITLLQPITDYMLAFFGSIDERVFDERISKYLRAGRLIENIDLHMRFHYPFYRVEKAYLALKESIKSIGAVIDTDSIELLDELFVERRYKPAEESYRTRILTNLNNILLV